MKRAGLFEPCATEGLGRASFRIRRPASRGEDVGETDFLHPTTKKGVIGEKECVLTEGAGGVVPVGHTSAQ